MRPGLDARTNDRQVSGVFARKQPSGHTARGSSTNGRDLAGIHDRDGQAVLRLEEDNEPLVSRLDAVFDGVVVPPAACDQQTNPYDENLPNWGTINATS